MRRLAVLALGLPLCSCGLPGNGSGPDLEGPFTSCTASIGDQTATVKGAPPMYSVIRLDDGGKSITVTTPHQVGFNHDATAAIALMTAECVLSETNAPATITQNMDTTTGIMGRQSDDYDGVNVQWSYSGGSSGGFEATFAKP